MSNRFTLEDLFVNLGSTLSHFDLLVTGVTYVMGLFFGYKSLMALRESTTPQGHGKVKSALLYLITAIVFLYLPSTISIFTNTFFDKSGSAVNQLLGYQNIKGPSLDKMLPVLKNYLSFIGLISFIRGFLLLSKGKDAGQQQQGGLGKSITHIIGGLLLMNIIDFINLVSNSLGFS